MPPSTGYATADYSPNADVEDFSFLADLGNLGASWWGAVDDSDGTKGRTFDDDGSTERPVDWIDFDDTGEAGWIRFLHAGTASAAGSYTVRVYPPNSANTTVSPSDTYGSDNAYDSNWVGYWPLSDVNDRTANGYDLTEIGGITVGGETGQVTAATAFDGSGDALGRADDEAAFKLAVGTISAWATYVDVGSFQSIAGYINNAYGYALRRRGTSDDISIAIGDGGSNIAEARGGALSASFNQYVGTWDEGSGVEVFQEGSSVDAAAGSGTMAWESFVGFAIGARNNDPDNPWQGNINDVQLHNVVRADAWITEEYNQSNDNATFWGTWTWVSGGGGTTYEYTMAGGIAVGGAAAFAHELSEAMVGGLVLGGAAAASKELNEYMAGGIVLGGAAAATLEKVESMAGGAVFGGAASTNIEKVEHMDGGVVLGGAATIGGTLGFTMDGGVTLGGAAAVSKELSETMAGGLTLGGAAAVAFELVETMAGGVGLGGAAPTNLEKAETMAGGLTLSGSAAVSIALAVDMDGGIVLTAVAVVEVVGPSPQTAFHPVVRPGILTLVMERPGILTHPIVRPGIHTDPTTRPGILTEA